MSKRGDSEARVKQHLDAIRMDGDWEVLLDLLHARGLRQSLINRRMELGLTQAEVAERMGIKQPTLSELETEQWPNPHMSTLAVWAHALGMRIDMQVYEKNGEGS